MTWLQIYLTIGAFIGLLVVFSGIEKMSTLLFMVTMLALILTWPFALFYQFMKNRHDRNQQ